MDQTKNHKGSFASPVTLFLKSMIKAERPIVYGDGSQTRDFIYVSDIIDTLLNLAQSDFSGIINVGSGVSRSFRDVIALINQMLGTNIEPEYVGRPSNYLENTLADISAMRKLTAIQPMSLEVGLAKYLAETGLRVN